MKETVLFYTLKIIEVSFYALFFLVPLILANTTSELFELNKMWLTWGLTVVIVASWVVKMIVNGQIKIVRTPLDIPLFLFFVSQLISTVISVDSHTSIWGYYSRFNGGLLSTIAYILLYYAFVSNVHDLKRFTVKKAFPLWTRIGILFGGILLLFLSIPLAAPSDPTSYGQSFLFYATLLIVFALSVVAFRHRFQTKLLMITLYSGVLVTLWGIPSHFGADPTCLLFRGSLDVECWTENFKPTIRIFSTLGQPAWMAAYLAFLIPILTALTLRFDVLSKTPFRLFQNGRFVIFFTLAMLCYVGLLFTNTRAGFIGFWLGNVAFWIGFFLMVSKHFRFVLKTAAVINISYLLLTFLFGIPFGQLQPYTLPGISQQANAQVQPPQQDENISDEASPTSSSQEQQTSQQVNITESGDIRLNVWQGAINAWRENPLFGTGVETFAFAYYQHKPQAQNLTSEWDFLYNKAHNEYLNYLTTTGIVGLLTYLLLIGWFLFLVLKWAFTQQWLFNSHEYENNSKLFSKRLLILGFVAGYVTILITNFFGFSVVIINLFFFLTPAFVFALNNTLSENKAYSLPHKTESLQQDLSGLRLASIIFVILIGLYLNMTLLRYLQADKEYALGANLDRVGEYVRALPHLENAVKLRPGEPTFRDELAFNYAAIASGFLLQEETEQAKQYVHRATELSNTVVTNHPNNVVFWKNRVRMYYLLSQVDPQYLEPALNSIQKAEILAPNDAKISYNHGVVLGQMGRIDEAIAELEHTVALKPNFRDVYFALALFYREKATEGTERVVNQEAQQKAQDALDYILTNINPNDAQALETLESWKNETM